MWPLKSCTLPQSTFGNRRGYSDYHLVTLACCIIFYLQSKSHPMQPYATQTILNGSSFWDSTRSRGIVQDWFLMSQPQGDGHEVESSCQHGPSPCYQVVQRREYFRWGLTNKCNGLSLWHSRIEDIGVQNNRDDSTKNNSSSLLIIMYNKIS